MNKRTVLYGVLLIVVYCLAVAYLPTQMIYLLGILLTVPVLSLCFLPLLWHWTVPVRMDVSEVTSADKPAVCRVMVENRGFLPVSMVECVLEAKYAFAPKPFDFCVTMSLPARDHAEIVVPLRFTSCGVADIYLKSVRVYDFLGLFSMSHATDMVTGAVLLPAYSLMGIRNREQKRWDISNADRHHATNSGEDPSEIVGFREMQPGDKLQQVHWKISAKADDWMVKQFSAPISCRICLFVDLDYKEMHQYNERMEMTLSLGLSLVDAECLFALVWYQKGQGLQTRIIADVTELYEAFAVLLKQSEPTGALDMEVIFGELSFEDRLRQMIYMTGVCSMEQCVALFAERKRLADSMYILRMSEEKKTDDATSAEVQALAGDVIYTFQESRLLEQLSLVELIVG